MCFLATQTYTYTRPVKCGTTKMGKYFVKKKRIGKQNIDFCIAKNDSYHFLFQNRRIPFLAEYYFSIFDVNTFFCGLSHFIVNRSGISSTLIWSAQVISNCVLYLRTFCCCCCCWRKWIDLFRDVLHDILFVEKRKRKRGLCRPHISTKRDNPMNLVRLYRVFLLRKVLKNRKTICANVLCAYDVKHGSQLTAHKFMNTRF